MQSREFMTTFVKDDPGLSRVFSKIQHKNVFLKDSENICWIIEIKYILIYNITES